MVFQHYALYPHMTVRENMAFGLRNAKVPKDEIEARVAEAARVLEIESQLDKKPGQMSGGQRQRVAIGRAIVKNPKLFLLDEPLSNLDAALRMRTRVELAQLRQRVDAALIMVTHDQAEAMTLADRIVVMNDRRIQQVGAPMEIYARPANAFVARFVGSPAMTLAPASLVDGGGAVRPGAARRRVGGGDAGAAGGAAGGRAAAARPQAGERAGRGRRRERHGGQGRAGRAARRADADLRPARRRPGDHRRGRGAAAGSGSATRSASGSRAPAAICSAPTGPAITPRRGADEAPARARRDWSGMLFVLPFLAALCRHPHLSAAEGHGAQPPAGRPVRRRHASSGSTIMRGCSPTTPSSGRSSTPSRSR